LCVRFFDPIRPAADLQTAVAGNGDIGDRAAPLDDTSKLTGGRYFISSPSLEERIQLLSMIWATQITVARGFEASTPGTWPAGARLKKLSPPSRPGEFHPEPLTDPDLSLSTHPARATP